MTIKREKQINGHNNCNCNSGCNCNESSNGCECTSESKCSPSCDCGTTKAACDCGCGSSECNCDDDCGEPHRRSDIVSTDTVGCSCGCSGDTLPHTDHKKSCGDGCGCSGSTLPHTEQGKSNDDGCACGKCMNESLLDSKLLSSRSNNKAKLIISLSRIAISVILILLGSLISLPNYVNLAFFIPAYLCIGGEYLYKAIRNILHGKVFDENFLMVIATIGAFAIGEYLEGVLVMELYFIGELLQEYAVDSSRRNIAELLNIKSPTANRLVNNQIVVTPTEELSIGDTITVAAGEKVPVDGVILSGASYLDTQALTGESKLRAVAIGDEVLGGCINTQGVITVNVTREFKDTSVAKILTLIEDAQDKKPTAEKFITKFAKYYTPIVVILAAIIAIIPPLFLGFSATFAQYLNKALVFLVISCPCALVISIPLGFFAGIGGASKLGILVKGGNHFESVNSIDYYLFDKTGTLTEGVFDIVDISSSVITSNEMLEIAAYAESSSNHPIAQSIIANYSNNIDMSRITNYREISGYGISLDLDNIAVLCGKSKLLEENGISLPHSDAQGSVVHLSRGGVYLGYIELGDRIRDDSKSLVAELLASNKHVMILSGDNETTVANVATKLGITEYHHSLLPEDKATIVNSLIKGGHKVAFVGDGLNDAPVLKLATLGICMSGLNNDASIEASDIVISGGKVGLISTLISKAKKTRSVVTQNIIFSLAVKFLIMAVSLAFFASMWLAILADVGVSTLAIINSMRAKK